MTPKDSTGAILAAKSRHYGVNRFNGKHLTSNAGKFAIGNRQIRPLRKLGRNPAARVFELDITLLATSVSFRASESRSFLDKDPVLVNHVMKDYMMVGKNSVKSRISVAVFVFLLFATAPAVFGQGSAISSGDLSPSEADRILKAFTAKESEFRQALNQYSFKRDAVLQSIGMGGQVTGEYHRVSYFTFDDSGTDTKRLVSSRCLHSGLLRRKI